MIYRCKKCNASLTYSAEKVSLCCSQCGASFGINEYVTPEVAASQGLDNLFADSPDDIEADGNLFPDEELGKNGYMQMYVCKCTNCGEKLYVSDGRYSRFCAQCGEPDMIMDHAEMWYKPDLVVPFSVGQREADLIVREKMRGGLFVPRALKKVNIEKITGLYVPFMIYDAHYTDEQIFSYPLTGGRIEATRYAVAKGACDFYNVPVDASKRLTSRTTERLEPFFLSYAKPFDLSYLSGYYCDYMDDNRKKTVAISKMRKLFDENLPLKIISYAHRRIQSKPQVEFTNSRYGLLPVWFLYFHYQKKTYTILVNGQTGKMVGAVPLVKWKQGVWFVVLGALFTALSTPVFTALFRYGLKLNDQGEIGDGVGILGVFLLIYTMITVFLWRSAVKKLKSIATSVSLTQRKVSNK